MARLKRYGYLLAFLVPATMPAAAAIGGTAGAWFPLFFLFVLLPLADYAIGRDASNPRDDGEIRALESASYYRALTHACLPLHYALLAWSGWHFAHAELSPAGVTGWLLSQGVVSGTLAINVAHELVHKRSRLEQWAGGALLASVGYAGFKVEHLRGHHVHVATPRDASSARYGEIVYPFVARALWRNTANAWRLEAARLAQRGLPWLHWRNELLWWSALTLLLFAAFATLLGPRGAGFFAAQGLVAAASLEIINYVEHYGLERRELAPGRHERTTHLHSWNSNYLLTNLMLFQLQRHSDHHESAQRRYQALVHHEDSPQLPGGYAAMYVLALVPPLWRRIIDPRVRAFRERGEAA